LIEADFKGAMLTAAEKTMLRPLIFALLIFATVVSTGQAADTDGKSNQAVTQTLAYHLATNAAARAVGHTPGDDMRPLANWRYAIYDVTNLPALTNSVWFTNFWLRGVRGLGATCIGFSNGMGGQGLVTMVSPRHYLFATHMHPEGFLIAFLDTNNVIYWRKTLERKDVNVVLPSGLSLDTSVGILNADLPPSVGFLPVVPTNLASYLPEDNSQIVQGIGMNQDMKLFGQPMSFGNPPLVVWDSHAASPDGVGRDWNVSIRSGDSSNPEMLLIGNQLVLLSHNYGVQAGPNYAYLFDNINKVMHELSIHNRVHSDYQLTPFSLESWPKVLTSASK
jgi:hypothetical protein